MCPFIVLTTISLMTVTMCATPATADDEALPPGALVRLGSTKFRLVQGAAMVIFSPDSKQLLCSDYNGTIQVRDVATGRLVHTWKFAQNNVINMRFSPNGKLLATTY